MLEAMRLSDLVGPLAGTLKGADARFDSVAYDSRAIQPGGLFVALAGARTNGHDHVADARARGPPVHWWSILLQIRSLKCLFTTLCAHWAR